MQRLGTFLVGVLCAGVVMAGGAKTYKAPKVKKYAPTLAKYYMGMILGYADSDWSSVVAQDTETQVSTPIAAKGDGADYGVFVGWQPINRFAIELSYIRLPDSLVTFGPLASGLSLGNTFNSDMFLASGVAKFILPMPKYDVSVFGLMGGAYLHREDPMMRDGDWSVIFGAGFRHDLNKRWFAEMQFMYTPGWGQSVLEPINTFLPEVYTLNLRLGYKFF